MLFDKIFDFIIIYMFGYANLYRSYLFVHLHQLHEYVNDFVHILLLWKHYLFVTWMVFCAIFGGMLFYKGSNVWGGEILIALKWKQKLEFNIFLFMHSRNFILEFGSVCWLKMLWKFLLCY